MLITVDPIGQGELSYYSSTAICLGALIIPYGSYWPTFTSNLSKMLGKWQ